MYIILETQSNNGEVTSIINQREDQFEAESVYYLTLSAAAISTVEKHSVLLLDDEGNMFASKCYKHGSAVATI